MTAAALDEGRSGNLQRRNARLHHIDAVLESASQDPSHKMEWGWPILGIRDPVGSCLALEKKELNNMPTTRKNRDLACRKERDLCATPAPDVFASV